LNYTSHNQECSFAGSLSNSVFFYGAHFNVPPHFNVPKQIKQSKDFPVSQRCDFRICLGGYRFDSGKCCSTRFRPHNLCKYSGEKKVKYKMDQKPKDVTLWMIITRCMGIEQCCSGSSAHVTMLEATEGISSTTLPPHQTQLIRQDVSPPSDILIIPSSFPIDRRLPLLRRANTLFAQRQILFPWTLAQDAPNIKDNKLIYIQGYRP
jgi:hypothetical protein